MGGRWRRLVERGKCLGGVMSVASVIWSNAILDVSTKYSVTTPGGERLTTTRLGMPIVYRSVIVLYLPNWLLIVCPVS